MDVVWKQRGRLGEADDGSASLPFGLLLLLPRMGAELEEVQRVGGCGCGGGGLFSLLLHALGTGEFLRGGVGGRPRGLGNAFTLVPTGAEMVYERLWRRTRTGLGERLRLLLV
jgi:hypothetical protein